MNPSMVERRSYSGPPLSEWLQFSERVLALGTQIVSTAQIPDDVNALVDHRLLALALLCRTLGNYQGVTVLSKEGLITEARTLARSCFENLIWTVGLVEGKERFAKEILDDQAKHLKSRMGVVSRDGLDQATLAKLKELEISIDFIMKRRPNAKTIKLDKVASNLMNRAYLSFRQLSADAAHTSFITMKRHIRRQNKGYSIAQNPYELSEREAAKAVDLATDAMMGVCIAVAQLLCSSGASDQIQQLWAEYVALSDAKGKLAAFT